MRNIFKFLCFVIFTIYTAGYFLASYEIAGFELKSSCFLYWLFSLMSYTVLLFFINLMYNMIDDLLEDLY